MCPLSRANVSSSRPDVSSFRANVSSFWPDVFTSAGDVFNFRRRRVPRSRGPQGGMPRGTWQVVRGDGEWLVTRVGVGLGGIGGRTGAGEGGCRQ